MKYLSVSTFVALSLLPIRLAGQDFQQVGIPTAEMDYFAASQKMSQWCWAACIQMVMNFHGVDLHQETIVARSFEASPFDERLPNVPVSAQLITSNLKGRGLDDSGHDYGVNCRFVPGPPAPIHLINQLQAGKPVIVGLVDHQGRGHAVVVTAATYRDRFLGPKIQTVTIRDPYPTKVNVENLGRVVLTGREFARCVSGTWMIGVSTER